MAMSQPATKAPGQGSPSHARFKLCGVTAFRWTARLVGRKQLADIIQAHGGRIRANAKLRELS